MAKVYYGKTGDDRWDDMARANAVSNARAAAVNAEYQRQREAAAAQAERELQKRQSYEDNRLALERSMAEKLSDYNNSVTAAKAGYQNSLADAKNQIALAQARANAELASARISAASSRADTDFAKSKYDVVFPKINAAIGDSKNYMNMYYALGGGRPITRGSLGLAENAVSPEDLAGKINRYSASAGAAMDRFENMPRSGGVSSAVLDGLIGGFSSALLNDAVSGAAKFGIDASTANKDYLIASQKLLDARNQTLSGLRSNTLNNQSALLNSLAGLK